MTRAAATVGTAAGPAVGWPARAGAWLGIGSSPAALVLGAGIAARHDGPAPLLGVLVGAVLMAALLAGQGLLGLAAPYGEHATLSGLAPRYLEPVSQRVLNGLLASAMIGWFGFNVGLGGAALAALLDLPGWAGPVLLGAPVVALAAGGMRRWNAVAVVTTLSALALVALVVARLAGPESPVTAAAGPVRPLLADLAAFVGYAAVFSLRAPDVSVGLRRPADLGWCVGLLVVPTCLVALAGVALQRATRSADLVASLASPSGLPVANLFVAAAVVAAALTTVYSGRLALRGLAPRLPAAPATAVVAVPGLALAVARFDRLLLAWLALLAALLPPLVVPMATERLRRIRGHAPRLVAWWTWLPAGAVGLVLTLVGVSSGPLVGLAVAGLATAAQRAPAPRP